MYFNKFNENLFRNKYRIKSVRLQKWNYSSDGYYFITICTKDREHFFGKIKNGIMFLNELGCIVHEQWKMTGIIRNNVILDEFVVMPDHIHGIIQIVETRRGASLTKHGASLTKHGASLRIKQNKFGPLPQNSLPSIINHFKGAIKRICNKIDINFHWQSRYHDRIIRNQTELNKIREYIKNNSLKHKHN